MIISRSLVKVFLTKVKIGTQNHRSAHQFKYGTSTSHESKASQLAQKDPPLLALHKKIRHYSHFTKRFAVIAQGCRNIYLRSIMELIQQHYFHLFALAFQ